VTNAQNYYLIFFGNLESELCSKFLYGTLQLFNNVALKLEANSITATEAFQTYSQLICQLEERKTHKFIPSTAKELLCTLKEIIMFRNKHSSQA
jgi:hypothetical protein